MSQRAGPLFPNYSSTTMPPIPKAEPPQPPDEAAAALLEVAAAAKAWHRSSVKGTKRLKAAVKAWIKVGG